MFCKGLTLPGIVKFKVSFVVNMKIVLLSVDKKTNKMSLFVLFISLLIVAQHVSGNHVPIIRS